MVDSIQNNLNLLNEGIGSIEDDKKKNKNAASFSRLLKENLGEVNDLQKEADQITRDFAVGEIDNVHQVTVAAEKARIALKLTLAIQNKVVDSYKKVMQMQV